MKIYQEKQEDKKSWAIKLATENISVHLQAIDSKTGGQIWDFIVFFDNGEIVPQTGFKQALEKEGYDPYEHNNRFDEDGGIIIG